MFPSIRVYPYVERQRVFITAGIFSSEASAYIEHIEPRLRAGSRKMIRIENKSSGPPPGRLSKRVGECGTSQIQRK